jgi:hypothetical protein
MREKVHHAEAVAQAEKELAGECGGTVCANREERGDRTAVGGY